MKQNKTILVLLTPSWVSNLLGALVALVLTIGTIILTRYQGSQLQQEIFEVHANPANDHAASGTYQAITSNVAHNSVFSVAPLFILWAFVGLIVYYFAVSIVSALSHVEELREQMEYVNASRADLAKEAVIQLVVRLVALAAWFGFIKLTLDVVVPYALAAAHLATNFSLTSVGYGLLAVAVIYADIYIHTLFLRLVTLKPRVF